MKRIAATIVAMSTILLCLNAYAQPPYDVERSIKERAEADNPGNYSLQNFEIKRQVSAYNQLDAWQYDRDIPQGTFDSLKESCTLEHPDNYSLQLFELKRQIGAYKFIQSYDYVDGVPDEVLREIKDRSAFDHPDNFSLQKFEIQRQVRAYLQMN